MKRFILVLLFAFLAASNFTLVGSEFGHLPQTDCGRACAEFIAPGPPVLRIANSVSGGDTLGWTPVAINFQAEQRTNLLSGPTWAALATFPRAPGNDFSVSISRTNPAQFFRLHQP